MRLSARLLVLLGLVSAPWLVGCTDDSGISCPPGQLACNGACTNVLFDPTHCGTCGNACPGQEVCIAGQCGCPQSQTACSDICVREDRDPQNCGSCGNVCPSGQVCSASKCALSCGSNLTQCGQSCVDTQDDPANCGGCGKACASGQFCQSGSCTTQCPSGFIRCLPDGGASDAGTVCADPMNDPLNCGGCGGADLPTPTPTPTPAPTDAPAPARPPHVCIGTPGANSLGVCTMGHCAFICEPGFGDCPTFSPEGFMSTSLQPGESACLSNLSSDNCNCGGCGIICDGNFEDGVCATDGQSADTQSCCDASCVSLSSPASCGSCGNTTTCGGSTPDCCAIDPSDVNHNACTNLATDVLNCGFCGDNCNDDDLTLPLCCASASGGGSQCTEGANISNCGSCGNVCTGVTPGCCIPQPGASPSPSPGANPCVDFNDDIHNCGNCGNDCTVGCTGSGAMPRCNAGRCQCLLP